jgi:hypothetical protein
MVGEHNQPGDAVTLPSDRAKFRSTWQLPPNFKIWIARCGVGGWQTAYLRHAGTVSATPGVRPEHRRKNIHSVTFGIGDLLVHALHTTAPDVDLGLTLSGPGVVIPLFPVVGEIMWPPTRSIGAEEAALRSREALASSRERARSIRCRCRFNPVDGLRSDDDPKCPMFDCRGGVGPLGLHQPL